MSYMVEEGLYLEKIAADGFEYVIFQL
jgi:hypothetical protein